MKRILVQFDTDISPSVFDRVVAVDADCDHIFSYGGVVPDTVVPHVYGAIFTRGPDDLKQTALFIGGSNVAAGEKLWETILGSFLGPLRCSVMMDSNGSNTTAAAAVLSAAKHVSLQGSRALVLGGTGPVGLRVAQLLALEGASVQLGSRTQTKASDACGRLKELIPDANVEPLAWEASQPPLEACNDVQIVIAAGAAGAELISQEDLSRLSHVQVAIDLNAVPPAGLGGIKATDKAKQRDRLVCYGAVGVGGLKMKIHKAAIRKLFESNDQLLETIQIYKLGQSLT
ncbi:MAG: methylenetetrahydromethanopterin dehydrogenase [Planctomycetota bacterium]|nr:methylenetetrahydromethanopterin dehydrogenase [Planctomycetota bacterium]